MPLKKGTPAYEARLARRRAQRKIDRLEKQKKETGIGTRTAMNLQMQINDLEMLKQRTYKKYESQKRVYIRSSDEILSSIKALNSYTPSEDVDRKNIQAMRELRLATKKDAIGPMKYSEGDVHIFFAATIRAWQGVKPEERGKAIMEYYGVSDLASFIDSVLDKNKLARDIYNGVVPASDIANDNELYQQASKQDSADKEKYPSLYMSYISEISSSDSLMV